MLGSDLVSEPKEENINNPSYFSGNSINGIVGEGSYYMRITPESNGKTITIINPAHPIKFILNSEALDEGYRSNLVLKNVSYNTSFEMSVSGLNITLENSTFRCLTDLAFVQGTKLIIEEGSKFISQSKELIFKTGSEIHSNDIDIIFKRDFIINNIPGKRLILSKSAVENINEHQVVLLLKDLSDMVSAIQHSSNLQESQNWNIERSGFKVISYTSQLLSQNSVNDEEDYLTVKGSTDDIHDNFNCQTIDTLLYIGSYGVNFDDSNS